MVSFLIHLPSFPEISFKKAPEKIMNLGNIGLLFIAILCNCAVFKKIGEQIGIEIDALHKEIKEVKSKQDLITIPQVISESGVIKRQISKPSLQQQISIPFGNSGSEQKNIIE
uniref:Uncharacterized protein n=1 Tax=Panagrolaimus sp. PS1159 TaxID=55785 RepID=A0AC35G3K3_9BILA